MQGDLEKEGIHLPERCQEIDGLLLEKGLVGFGEVGVVHDLESGIISTVQANGFAGLQANTVMFGWPDNREGMVRLLKVMRTLEKLELSTIIARLPNPEGFDRRNRIDIWWRGRQHNGDLMLLLAHLMTLNNEWRDSRIFLRSIIPQEDGYEAMSERLRLLIEETRIHAEANVIMTPSQTTFLQTMHQESKKTDVVFLGLKMPTEDEIQGYAQTLLELAVGPAGYIMVRNAGPFRGKLIL